MTTTKISLVTLAPARQRLALRVVLARYIDEERAERNRAIEDGDQPNLWSARLDAFEVDPKALPDPFKAAFTAMFGDEKVQFGPDGVACEIWADRVELWMGDGRAIRVPRHELMGSQEKKRGGYVTIAYEMGRGKRVKVRVPREAACG